MGDRLVSSLKAAAQALRALSLIVPLCACQPSAAQTASVAIGPDAAVSTPARAERPLIGVNMRHREDARFLPLARAAGVDFVRTDLFWGVVEEVRGTYDFSHWDGWMAQLDAAGLSALFILDYGHERYGDEQLDNARELDGFARFATAAAAHYRGRGVAFEIWNEPDVDESTRFHTPENFARLVTRAAAAVHGGDPDATVASGGLSWMDFDYLEPVLAAWAREGAPEIAAVGLHPYGTDEPEELIEGFADQAALQRRYGIDLPIWNTEYGFSSGEAPGAEDANGLNPEGRRRQAVLLARQMLALWIAGLERTVWYEFVDDGVSSTDDFLNFGMLADDGSPKPAYHALAAFHRHTNGARLAGALTGLPQGVWGARFESADRVVVALWVADPDVVLSVAPETEGLLSVTDMLGAPLPRERLLLRETDGPIYLTWR